MYGTVVHGSMVGEKECDFTLEGHFLLADWFVSSYVVGQKERLLGLANWFVWASVIGWWLSGLLTEAACWFAAA